MLVCLCAVISTLFCTTMAYEIGTSPRLGTVLFSKEDIQKSHWTNTQISLLQARRYFQTILPRQDFKNNYNDDYVIKLLKYIKDGYSNIKREAVDLETDSIMTAAFSDTLGGYFKAWVLPVAKLNYYGGTLSQDKVIKLFQFYGELKAYLDTDGQGWCTPDDTFLKAIPINIAPTRKATTHIADPCEQFAYFEKTSSGLGIPLPKVNWNDKSSTLFVPLRNMTLIPMIARDTSDTLVKYYNTAKCCLAETSTEDVKKFVTKFRTWLSDNIMPHLKDEPLYLALGNVLTLANITPPHYNYIELKDRAAPHSFKCEPMPIDVPSRKVTIILIILFLELAWCIPALIYVLFAKKKKDCTSNVYLFIDQNKPDRSDKQDNLCKTVTLPLLEKINNSFCRKNKSANKKDAHITECNKTEASQNLETQFPSDTICATSSLTRAAPPEKPKETDYSEFQGQYPSSDLTKTAGTGSRTYYSSKNQACETVQLAPRESKRSVLKKSSGSLSPLKNNPSVKLSKPTEENSLFNVSYVIENKSPTALNRNHDKGPKGVSRKRSDRSKDSKAMLQIKSNSKNDEQSFEDLTRTKIHPEILNTPPETQTGTDPKNLPASQIDSIVNAEREQSSVFYFADTAKCPCTGCINNINNIHEEILSGSIVATDKPSNENIDIPTLPSTTPHYAETQVIEIKSVRPIKDYTKPTKSRKVIEVRDTKQFYQMAMRNPTTEINVNICAKQITAQNKRSKIPKLANPSKLLIPKLSGHSQRALSTSKESKKKSLIPQLIIKALDDTVLDNNCCRSNAYSRFNDTI